MSRQVAVIVDDDPDIRAMVAMKLTSAGYTVHEEVDGEAGLAAIQQLDPTVVVLDWMMPRMNGLEVLQRVRSDEATRHVPVLLLTARAQEDAIERGFAAGADDYVVKPFSPRELLTRIDALRLRSERRPVAGDSPA
jgi:two-component system phosphate regulon response regulator PhoB